MIRIIGRAEDRDGALAAYDLSFRFHLGECAVKDFVGQTEFGGKVLERPDRTTVRFLGWPLCPR
jgi:hypothetical protein